MRLIGNWSYDSDYLHDVHAEPTAVGTLDPEVLARPWDRRGSGAERQRRRLKRLALNALVSLRSAPPLRQRGAGHPAALADPGQELAAGLT